MANNPFDELLNRVQQGPLGLVFGDQLEQLRAAATPQQEQETQPTVPQQQPTAAETGKPTARAAGRGQPADFGSYEQQYGLPEGYLSRTAQIESSMNPNAQNPNSSAGGLFQFIDSTARAYGLRDKFDPVASTDAASRLARDNAATLRTALGREPTGAELYLAHQQGGRGAARLLSNPGARAADIVGSAAVALNGGDQNMTAGEFASLWQSKFEGGARPASSAIPSVREARAANNDIDPRAQESQQQPQPMEPEEAKTFIDKLIRDLQGGEGGDGDGLLGLGGGGGGGQTQQAALPSMPAPPPAPRPRTVAPQTQAAITEIMAAGSTEPVYKAPPYVRLELMREIGRERRRMA